MEKVKDRLQQMRQTMDKTSAKPSDVASQSQTSCDLPAQPLWMQEETLLVYSPSGLRASNKVPPTYIHNKTQLFDNLCKYRPTVILGWAGGGHRPPV